MVSKGSPAWRRVAVQALRAAGERIDSLMRLMGEGAVNVNVRATVSKEVVDAIILGLAPWPDARQMISERLEALALSQVVAQTAVATDADVLQPVSKGH